MPATALPRVAVAGCGYWGKNLVRNFRTLSALAAVIDPSPAGRAAAAQFAPGVPVFDSLAAAREAIPFHGLAIATPAATHHAVACEALAAGLDLMVEKPLALELADGADLVARAARSGRIVQVGHILEYHPALPVLTEWVRSGRLGRLRRLQAHRTNWGMVRTEEDALWSIAPHDIAMILRLAGRMPETVACQGTHILDTPRADCVTARLRFDDGLEAHFLASWHHPVKEQRLVAVGDRGMAVFDDLSADKKLAFFDEHVRWTPEGRPELVKNLPEYATLVGEEPLLRECKAFLEAVATRTPPLADGESGLRVLAVLDACRRSMLADGAPVACALAKSISPDTRRSQ